MVKFRFRFKHQNASNLVDLYSEKWKSLLTYVFNKQKSKETYKRLKDLREDIHRDVKVDDVIEYLYSQNSDTARMLADCSVLFDSSPYDLKIFILTVLNYKN